MSFTPGPWIAEIDRRTRSAAHHHITISGERHGQYVVFLEQIEGNAELESFDDNAQLIAASPQLLKACKLQHDAIDILFARLIELDHSFYPSKSGKPWEAILAGNAAIRQAEPPASESAEGRGQ